MTGYDVPWKSWVLVCDGARALFMQNDGDADLLNLKIVEHYAQPDDPARELGTDRPGRTFQSAGSRRSAMEETDPHVLAEADFLKETADRLNAMVEARVVESISLIAPPTALGVLRKHLSAATREAVLGEIDKDLVKLPVIEIERYLAGMKSG